MKKYFILPYDAFNGSLVEQFICWDAGHKINTIAKQRITHSGLIVSVLHLPDVSGMARDRKKVFLFCVFRMCPVYLLDVSGIIGTRTLIGLQLSLWFIYFHISLIYSEACDLLNLSGLWASPELNFKYGNFIWFMVKIENWLSIP